MTYIQFTSAYHGVYSFLLLPMIFIVAGLLHFILVFGVCQSPVLILY